MSETQDIHKAIRVAEIALCAAILFHDNPDKMQQELSELKEARDGLRNFMWPKKDVIKAERDK